MRFINPVKITILRLKASATDSRVLVRFVSADVPAVDFLTKDPDDAYEQDEIQLQTWTTVD